MGKEKKRGQWRAFLRGGITALCLYLVAIFVLAFVIVKGILPEQAAFAILTVASFLASAMGGGAAVKRSLWATLPSAMLSAVIFAALLILVGVSVWPETFWTERSAVCVISVLAGGFSAGIWGAGKKGRRRVRKG